MGKFLDRAALLGALKLQTEFVLISGKSGVMVTQMSAVSFIEMWDGLEKDGDGNVKNVDLNTKLLAHCIVDEAGERLLTDPADMVALRNSNPKVFKKLISAARRMNGLDGEVEKNSEAGQKDDSLSGSPQD